MRQGVLDLVFTCISKIVSDWFWIYGGVTWRGHPFLPTSCKQWSSGVTAARVYAFGRASSGTCNQSSFSFQLDFWVTQPLVFHALGCRKAVVWFLTWCTPLINFGCQGLWLSADWPSGSCFVWVEKIRQI
jgi:hypothetical protein